MTATRTNVAATPQGSAVTTSINNISAPTGDLSTVLSALDALTTTAAVNSAVTQFDPTDGHYDPTSKPDDPRWLLVDLRYKRHLKRAISLNELKERSEALGDFVLTRKGNRLSILPVTAAQWAYILGLEGT